MKFGLLTNKGNDDKLCVSESQRELLAVITPVRSVLLFIGNFAGRRLIQYPFEGNRPDCLIAVENARFCFFRQNHNLISKLLGGHIMPANSLLEFVDKLDHLIECLRAILQLMANNREHNYLSSLIQLICEQMEQLSINLLTVLRQEEAIA